MDIATLANRVWIAGTVLIVLSWVSAVPRWLGYAGGGLALLSWAVPYMGPVKRWLARRAAQQQQFYNDGLDDEATRSDVPGPNEAGVRPDARGASELGTVGANTGLFRAHTERSRFVPRRWTLWHTGTAIWIVGGVMWLAQFIPDVDPAIGGVGWLLALVGTVLSLLPRALRWFRSR